VSAFVLDASATVAWSFAEELDARAQALLELVLDARVVVPPLWFYEVANALLVAERRGRLVPGEAEKFLDMLATLSVDSDDRPQDMKPIVALSRRFGLTAYDAAYLELALRLGLPLATRDARLAKAAQQAGIDLLP